MLQVVDLAVALFLVEEDNVTVNEPDIGAHIKHENKTKALRHITSVLSAIDSLSRVILDSLDSDDWAFTPVRLCLYINRWWILRSSLNGREMSNWRLLS